MRILFTSHQFFPEHGAGTEVLTLGLARTLAARGHEVSVFAAKRSAPFADLRSGEVEDYEYAGIPVRRIGRPRESLSRPFRLSYDNPEMAAGFRECAREFRPDVIHFMHLQGLSASVIPVVKEELGIPAVYTATDFWAICPVVNLMRHDGSMCYGPDPAHCPRCLASRREGSRTAEVVRRVPGPILRAADLLSRRAPSGMPLPLRQVRDLSERPERIRERINSLDRVIAPAGLMRDILVANGVAPDLVEVSHYGIDASRIHSVSRNRSAGSENTGVRFGFIGTLGPHKGCDLLIRAFRSLPEDAGATLAVHGGSPEFEDFGEEIKRLTGGEARISFAGPFPPDRVGEILSGLDALVVPSRWYENTPVVIYEAFAAGVPVIATDLGGMSEVVKHDENGLLFPLDDERELARRLRRVVEEPGLLARLRSGIGPVKTVEESATEMESLYSSLLERVT